MKNFGQILKIKEFRQELAEQAVLARHRSLEEATRAEADAGRRLEEYRDYAQQQERRIYRNLCSKAVRLRDIEDVHAQVLAMRQRERTHEDDLHSAEERRGDEETQLEEERDVLRIARQTHDKFVQLADVFEAESRECEERREEGEIEEAAEVLHSLHANARNLI
jgi:type III secretion protein O